MGKNNANYFLVNDGVPLYIKQGNSYGNSMPDIALMDKYTLGVGPNLMPDLTLYNPLRIIDSRKKFYIVKYPRKSNKSNIYSPIIYNQLNKEGREIVDEYIKLLDMKLDKTIDPLKVESSYTSFTSILVKAINNLPDDTRGWVFPSKSLIGAEACQAYKERHWEFLEKVNSFNQIRNLLAMYLLALDKTINPNCPIMIPNICELGECYNELLNKEFTPNVVFDKDKLIPVSLPEDDSFTTDGDGQLTFAAVELPKEK